MIMSWWHIMCLSLLCKNKKKTQQPRPFDLLKQNKNKLNCRRLISDVKWNFLAAVIISYFLLRRKQASRRMLRVCDINELRWSHIEWMGWWKKRRRSAKLALMTSAQVRMGDLSRREQPERENKSERPRPIIYEIEDTHSAVSFLFFSQFLLIINNIFFGSYLLPNFVRCRHFRGSFVHICMRLWWHTCIAVCVRMNFSFLFSV